MRVSIARQIVVTLMCSFILGCAFTPVIECPPGQEQAVNEQLYFGTAKPSGIVSEREWADFLRFAVTPRFPKGFTHWQAMGQWQGKDGAVVSENAYVLSLIHPDADNSETAVRSIVSEYKRLFKQEAVLRVKGYGCVLY